MGSCPGGVWSWRARGSSEGLVGGFCAGRFWVPGFRARRPGLYRARGFLDPPAHLERGHRPPWDRAPGFLTPLPTWRGGIAPRGTGHPAYRRRAGGSSRGFAPRPLSLYRAAPA